MMNKPKKIGIALCVVISLLLIVPLLIPLQTYLRQAEHLASVQLGQPVSIGSAHLFFLPSPHVTAHDIVLGKNQALKIDALVLTPTLTSLFSDTKTIDLQFKKPVMKKAALDFIAALSSNKQNGSDTAKVHVRRIEVDELELAWPNMMLPVLSADVTLSVTHALEFASIASTDGALKVDVIPNGDEQLIALDINKWTLPAGLPLLIDQAKFEMRLKGSQLAVPSIDIEMYGGKITGEANLSWTKNWKLNGKLHVDHLAVQQPSRMVSKSVYLSGHLFADGNFSSMAKEAGGLSDNLQTNFKFKVNSGVLHGLDLVKIASLLIKQKQGGGETQFDAFTGNAQVRGKQYKLSNLNVQSGLLGATGRVTVAPSKALSGEVKVEVKNSANMVAIPMNVSGTLDSPIVFPTKSALIGGALGTVVLPGAGTAAGVQAAEKAEKVLKGLFGD